MSAYAAFRLVFGIRPAILSHSFFSCHSSEDALNIYRIHGRSCPTQLGLQYHEVYGVYTKLGNRLFHCLAVLPSFFVSNIAISNPIRCPCALLSLRLAVLTRTFWSILLLPSWSFLEMVWLLRYYTRQISLAISVSVRISRYYTQITTLGELRNLISHARSLYTNQHAPRPCETFHRTYCPLQSCRRCPRGPCLPSYALYPSSSGSTDLRFHNQQPSLIGRIISSAQERGVTVDGLPKAVILGTSYYLISSKMVYIRIQAGILAIVRCSRVVVGHSFGALD
ncbi:hypothetical protein F4778DRAFT_608181 [Xylariomycetidae sp. FL2044]|nr:hypothetical protein F4778DRAFT_608181 [Xylariomycetidae sp. FL2044]